MKVNPKSEQEFKSRNLLDPGTYDFTVLNAVEKVSKNSGEPMIEIIIHVFGMDGRRFTIYDYLIDKEPMDFKLRHIAHISGVLNKYEEGEVNANDLIGKKGKVKVSIRKDTTGIYGDKNQIVDYIVEENNKNVDFFNDPLLF